MERHGGVSLLGAVWGPCVGAMFGHRVWMPCLGAMYGRGSHGCHSGIHYVSPLNHRCLYGGVSCSVIKNPGGKSTASSKKYVKEIPPPRGFKISILQLRSCYQGSGVFSPNFMCFIKNLFMGSPKLLFNSHRLQACDCRTPSPHLHRPKSSAVIPRYVRHPLCRL